MTIYNVVPADRFFNVDLINSFPTFRMAEEYVAGLKAAGDDRDYGIFEIRLIGGSAKMTFGRKMHVVGDRRVITGKHHLGGYSAHDDGLGEDGSPYGHGDTPEAAIADLLETIEAARDVERMNHTAERKVA